MPEGDTIHKIAAAMAPRLAGARLARIDLAGRHGAAPAPSQVLGVRAHGKHLLVDLEGGHSLRVHLGMYGSWHRYRHGEAWRKPARRASLVLDSGADLFVCFGAKEVEVLATPSLRAGDLFRRLGPDLIGGASALPGLAARAREFNAPHAPLADVLLDQRVACGIGNVYKSEVLFLERLSPWRRLGDTDDASLAGCYARAAELLERNLGGGRRATRFARDGRGRLWVYGRDGRRCLRCEPGVVRREAMGRDRRGTYWCAACQPAA